jgi:quercetin dioxygenase-like cupin family protein
MNQILKFNRKKFLSLCWAAPFLSFCSPVRAFSGQNHQNKQSRRVVTGLNAEGKSIIISDGVVPKNATYSSPKEIRMDTLWVGDEVPVDFVKKPETLEGYNFALEPPHGGFNAYFITLEPGIKPYFHQTNTIDFIFIISGKLELLLEGSSTILSSGDSVVQRGTNHAWRVIGEESCTLAAVLISAKRS